MNCPDCSCPLTNAFRCKCGWRSSGSAIFGTVETVDIRDQVKARMIERANATLPIEFQHMTPAQCVASLRRMGGVARAVRLPERQPGEDDE